MTVTQSSSEVSLKRVLSLTDLIIYGIILIQPVAALPLFGHANNISKGHAVTTILIAMVAMIFTAVSYGRMASIYPAAGSGMAGQLGASRLLYGMGRDKVIPNKIFGHLDKKNASPTYNVIFVGILALLGAFLLNYEECARLINFGAFFAFMGVNIATMREFYFKPAKKTFRSFLINFLLPAAGFIFCFIIWLNLPLKTFIIGGSWMVIGIFYLTFHTKGFRHKLIFKDFLKS